jgi:hypothetical protein
MLVRSSMERVSDVRAIALGAKHDKWDSRSLAKALRGHAAELGRRVVSKHDEIRLAATKLRNRVRR